MSDQNIDESVYLRVTTPLQVFNGYGNIPTHILVNKADIGQRVHGYCELYALRMLFGEIEEDCVEYVNAFIKWFDENVEEVIFTERRLYCESMRIQGMPDLVCKIKGQSYSFRYCLVDLKTSLKYSKSWDLQTAAYRYLCTENDIPIEERVIIHLHKDGTYDLIEYKDYLNEDQFLDHLNVYAACLRAHRFFND